MEREIYNAYVRLLEQELVPAMGCTEPIAVAYAAAVAAEALGELPESVDIAVSANIIKNVKSVIVPNTGGLHGLEAAAAAGIIAGQPDKKLLVISKVTPEQVTEIEAYLQKARFTVRESQDGNLFDIQITLTAGNETASCRITDSHTNVVSVVRNGKVLLSKTAEETKEESGDKALLQVEKTGKKL